MRAELACGQQLLDQDMNAREAFRKSFVADLFPVDADAFVDSLQVRRGVEPGAESSAAQNGFEKCRGRALAVRSGEVHAWVSAVRSPQPLRQDRDVLQIEFRRRGMRRRTELPAEGEKTTDGVVVIHADSSSVHQKFKRGVDIALQILAMD